jgi:hypothetical protein
MKRRKALDMLERRMRRGREEVDFTGGIVRSFFFLFRGVCWEWVWAYVSG